MLLADMLLIKFVLVWEPTTEETVFILPVTKAIRFKALSQERVPALSQLTLILDLIILFSDSFDFLVSLGLGYGVTVIEDSLSGNARYDPTFLLTPGVGGRWNFSTNYAFEFGYRYVREDEVPAHAFELGLSGKI